MDKSQLSEEQKARYNEILKVCKENKYFEYYLKQQDDNFADSKNELMYSEDKGPEWFFEDQFRRDLIDGGLECTDEKLISAQRSIIPYLLKKIGSAIIRGKLLTVIQTPVEICDPISTSMRMLKSFGYLPTFYPKAVSSSDPLEQMCYVITMWIAGFHQAGNQRNPFECSSGETYQGSIGGVPVYTEQSSPLGVNNEINYYIPGEGYTVSGRWRMVITVWPNSAVGHAQGVSTTHFKNTNAKIKFQLPAATIFGMVMGKRRVEYGGKFYAWDEENNLFCEMIVGKNEKSFWSKKLVKADQIQGKIWKTKPGFFDKVKDGLKKTGHLEIKISEKDFQEEKATIDGSWLYGLDIGGTVYWKWGDVKPNALVDAKKVLPSDSMIRPDIITRVLGDHKTCEDVRTQLLDIDDADVKKRKKDTGKKWGIF